MKVTRKAGKIDAIRLAIVGLDATEAKVGWFESARTEDGKPVAGIAAVQEFGSTKRSIPPRPFFRTTAEEKQQDWARLAGRIAKKVMLGEMGPDAVAEAMAQTAEANVRTKIGKIRTPPLSIITLLARKYRKDFNKNRKKQMANGPTQEYKMSGKVIGMLADKINDGPPDVSGVSTKPLVDTGYMLATLTSQVTKK